MKTVVVFGDRGFESHPLRMPNILNLRGKDESEEPEPEKQVPQTKKSAKASNDHLEWSAPEFNQYSKSKSWFMVTGVIASGLFLWALLTKNFLFGLLIGLAYFSIVTYGLKTPRNIRLAITTKGIRINQTLYEFDNLKSFWIFYDPPEIKELSLRSKKIVMPYIKIPLGEQNPTAVRRLLIKYLPERKQTESLIESLARQFRF